MQSFRFSNVCYWSYLSRTCIEIVLSISLFLIYWWVTASLFGPPTYRAGWPWWSFYWLYCRKSPILPNCSAISAQFSQAQAEWAGRGATEAKSTKTSPWLPWSPFINFRTESTYKTCYTTEPGVPGCRSRYLNQICIWVFLNTGCSIRLYNTFCWHQSKFPSQYSLHILKRNSKTKNVVYILIDHAQ